MFISADCKNGSKFCFEVKFVSFCPEEGISIYGEKYINENPCIFVPFEGEIKMTADTLDWYDVTDCQLPNMGFCKYEGKLMVSPGPSRDISQDGMMEELYNRLKIGLFNEGK